MRSTKARSLSAVVSSSCYARRHPARGPSGAPPAHGRPLHPTPYRARPWRSPERPTPMPGRSSARTSIERRRNRAWLPAISPSSRISSSSLANGTRTVSGVRRRGSPTRWSAGASATTSGGFALGAGAVRSGAAGTVVSGPGADSQTASGLLCGWGRLRGGRPRCEQPRQRIAKVLVRLLCIAPASSNASTRPLMSSTPRKSRSAIAGSGAADPRAGLQYVLHAVRGFGNTASALASAPTPSRYARSETGH